MPKIFDWLINACFENKSSDYTAGPIGRFWWNTTSGQAKVDDGTNVRALIRNDQKAIIGNSGTASQNIRLQRGAAGVLQTVTGDDVTAEGSLSTSLNQLSSRHENYADASKPVFGNAGRIIWTTDLARLQVDTGTTWVQLSAGATAAWDFIVGSAAQVSAGTATNSTIASAISAASAGNTIYILAGTFAEAVSVSKQLNIFGNGYGTYINGAITFTNAADKSRFTNIRTSDDITLNSGADSIIVSDVWLASGKTFVDNGTANYLTGMQE